MSAREVEEALDDSAAERTQKLMRKAAKALQSMYGWDERTAASVMLTVTSVVSLAPKHQQ